MRKLYLIKEKIHLISGDKIKIKFVSKSTKIKIKIKSKTKTNFYKTCKKKNQKIIIMVKCIVCL